MLLAPYPFQVYGIKFLAFKKRAVLADSMGNGKSCQAILASVELKSRRTLIICPASLMHNWRHEIAKWLPRAPVTLLEGSAAQKEELLSWYREGFLIISYHTCMAIDNPNAVPGKKAPRYALSPLAQAIAKIEFGCVIADEAHRMANRKSRTAIGAKLMVKNIPARFALTGTPIRNKVTDLWSVLNWIDPSKWSSFWTWAEEYCGAGKQPLTGQYLVMDHATDPAKLDRHLAPYLLHRSKEQTGIDLPPLTVQTVWVSLPPEQRAYYNRMEKKALVKLASEEVIEAPIILSKILRLKQLALAPEILENIEPDEIPPQNYGTPAKLAALYEVLDGTDEPVVVFSQFKRVLKLVQRTFAESPTWRRCYLYTGDETPAERDETLQQWNAHGGILLATAQTGGEGLNLIKAALMVNLDRWWNGAIEDQKVARLHRTGQTRPVTVINLLAEDTIDEWIESIVDYKRDLTRAVMDRARKRGVAMKAA